MKTVVLLLLASISTAAYADLHITVTNSQNQITEERIETENLENEIAIKADEEIQSVLTQNTDITIPEIAIQDVVIKDDMALKTNAEMIVEKQEIPQEVLTQEQKTERILLEETHSITTENPIFKFKQTGLAESKTAYITVKYENQVISTKGYFAKQTELTFTSNLSKSYGLYEVEYVEYDSFAILKKKLKVVRYYINYKKTNSNYKPKVSSSVQSNHPEIINLAMDITALAQNEMDKMKAINMWIATNVTYNHARDSYTQKNDAVTSLEKRTAICMGYANLFAALARAAGLETKVMTGRAVSAGKKYYHQWNEVKVDGKWYFVDTTWNASVRSGPETFITPANQYPSSHTRAKEVKAL